MSIRHVYLPCPHGRTYPHLIVQPLLDRIRGRGDRIDELDYEDENHCGGGRTDTEYRMNIGNIVWWQTLPGNEASTTSFTLGSLVDKP